MTKYFNNHFLFSETYINEFFAKKKRNNVDESLENAFHQVMDWYKEYISGDYSSEPWSDYIDAILDVLGFQKINKGPIRLLYVNTVSENEKPIAICYVVDKESDISSVKSGKSSPIRG
jgi:hypothetical protein